MATHILLLMKRSHYEGKKYIVTPTMVPLTLDSLAPLSTQDNVTGKWISASKYIGKYLSGEYYVRADHSPSITWPATGVPVGYFMETGDRIPFMFMFNFLPEKLAGQSYGRFVRTYLPAADLNFEWFRAKP